MFAGYHELNALPAETFLNPDLFVTPFDGQHTTYHAEQYAKGLRIGTEYPTITIGAYGTWGAYRPNSSVSSYEGIGYHACTADLLRGFLDSPACIIVYRLTLNGITETTIKGLSL